MHEIIEGKKRRKLLGRFVILILWTPKQNEYQNQNLLNQELINQFFSIHSNYHCLVIFETIKNHCVCVCVCKMACPFKLMRIVWIIKKNRIKSNQIYPTCNDYNNHIKIFFCSFVYPNVRKKMCVCVFVNKQTNRVFSNL